MCGKVFEVVEAAKAKFNLVDYSVSQATLEQVFIDFAREKSDIKQREDSYRAGKFNNELDAK